MNWRIDMELWGSTAIVLNESIVIGSRTKQPTRDAGIDLRSPTGLAILRDEELTCCSGANEDAWADGS